MNGVLYALTAGGVAIVVALAFVQSRDFAKIGSTDMVIAAAFLSMLAAAACILIYSRWGRRLRWRLEWELREKDEQVRRDARTKGLVRKPPLGPLP